MDLILAVALQDVPDPVMPPATSGGTSAEVVQHPSGYGQSSSSDSGSKSDADPAAEKGVQGAAEMRANMQKIWRELQGWQADAEARAAADVEAKQAATSSTSLLPSSSSSEDENQAEQQPAASGEGDLQHTLSMLYVFSLATPLLAYHLLQQLLPSPPSIPTDGEGH